MAGHSQFKNIMHRKGAQDAKKAKLFNKIAREITVACKTGSPDPTTNPRLRAAIAEARVNNMPRERIERAIKVATSPTDTSTYDEVRYEGYGPGGIALIVEALTDNRQRTAPEIRATFSKNGGTLGELNSVSFMFQRCGVITYPAAKTSAETMFEAAIDAGAENVESDATTHTITTTVDGFAATRDALEEKFGEANSAKLAWQPLNTVPIAGEAAQTLMDLIDALEDNDDVQNVYVNAELSEADAEKLRA